MTETALPSARFGGVVPALFAGALGLAPLGLQPVLATAGDWHPDYVSGSELAVMALTCVFFVSRPMPASVCGLLMALGHLVALLSAELVVPGVLSAGTGEGGLCAIAIRALLSNQHPIRAASLFTGLSTLPHLAGWLVQMWHPGLSSACLFLAVSGILAAMTGQGEPGEYGCSPLSLQTDQARTPFAAGGLLMIALVGILNFSGNLVWVDMAGWRDSHGYPGVMSSTAVLLLCMIGQIATTFAMARFAPKRRVAGWLMFACAMEAAGVLGMLAAPNDAAFMGAGLFATAAWQATLPLATGLYLIVAGPAQARFILPASLGGMALASGVAGAVPPREVVGCLTLIIVAIGAGVAARALLRSSKWLSPGSFRGGLSDTQGKTSCRRTPAAHR